MLLFIRIRNSDTISPITIQIHLMLLFILYFIPSRFLILHSNTSHVIVYPLYYRSQSLLYYHSNTSHVIVYRITSVSHFPRNLYSNTSHVIVYPGRGEYYFWNLQFKYISCYCLSCIGSWLYISDVIQIHLMLLFISFCSRQSSQTPYSNTSHVIVYLFPHHKIPVSNAYSNTSHVIVYLPSARRSNVRVSNSNTSHVIVYRRRKTGRIQKVLFKYISCYCLSCA